jgi:MraZ protein
MAVFLSMQENRIDKKGRVSVPASFRSVLAEQSPTGTANTLVVFRSTTVPALEACSAKHMEELARDLDLMDLTDEEREDYDLLIFGASQALPIDPEGRIILPDDLREFAGITGESVTFVGKRSTFQIWNPDAIKERMAQAQAKRGPGGVSLASIGAAARRRQLGA